MDDRRAVTEQASLPANSGAELDPGVALRRNAMRLLVAADALTKQAAEEIGSRSQWPALLDLCRQWKLLSTLEARLGQLGIAPPEPVRMELSRLTQPAFVQTMLCIRAGTTALTALDRADIRCAAFKGLAALAYLYPGLRSRTLQDVDVLIHPSDLETALTVLDGHGFQRSPGGPLGEYIAFLRNSPGTAGNEAVSLRDAKGGAVDLHWRLGGLEVETLLGGARHVEVLKRCLPVVAPGHAMLLSAHHALRNDFVPGDIARDVCDFAHWEPLLTETGERTMLGADADRWGLSAACLALSRIVDQFREISEGDRKPGFARGGTDRALARQLSNLYFRQLRTGAVNTDLAYVASPRPFLQVAAGLAGGWKRYREFMRRSEQSNGEASLTVHARLWKLGKSLAALSPSEWAQIRALALAKDRMAGPRTPREGDTFLGPEL